MSWSGRVRYGDRDCQDGFRRDSHLLRRRNAGRSRQALGHEQGGLVQKLGGELDEPSIASEVLNHGRDRTEAVGLPGGRLQRTHAFELQRQGLVG
ncbi:MAG: hypothetical protein H6509_12445 [Bryobacterales bacterium]|nr:hypothetical protein [Acidobacteriota bacterium]MCB9385416.1 hypothetical protein [Bryobacterales bacterium]